MNFIEKNTKKVALFLCLATAGTAITTVYAASNSTGWQRDGVYIKEDGKAASGWLILEEGTYYCDSNGWPLKGWQVIDNKTFYFNAKGIKLAGEQIIDGYRYTFTDKGVLMQGWNEDKSSYYTKYGDKLTGLQTIDGKNYQFDESGQVVNGWATFKGKNVYFNEDGTMAVKATRIGADTYYFNTDGSLTKGWKKKGKEMFYYDKYGAMIKGWATIKGKDYYFNRKGEMLENTKYAGFKFDKRGVAKPITEADLKKEAEAKRRKTRARVNVYEAAWNPTGSGMNADAASIASTQLGSSYVWGGSAPGGFDCSGLTYYAYGKVGITIPRTAGGQASIGSAVSYNKMMPGDLIVWNNGEHVSIYTGGGNMVHATNPVQGVISSGVSYWRSVSGQSITAIRRP